MTKLKRVFYLVLVLGSFLFGRAIGWIEAYYYIYDVRVSLGILMD